MAPVLVCVLLFLAMSGHSSATYCMCKDGVSDSQLQKNIDYACGAGADCSPILQSGACYNPNTIKDHCNYAVNSYFQKKAQTNGSCDFSGTATTTQSLSSTNSACVYPTSATSSGTNTTPSTGTTITPSTGTTTTTPSTVFGISPSAGITTTDSGSVALQTTHLLFWPFSLILLLSLPTPLRV